MVSVAVIAVAFIAIAVLASVVFANDPNNPGFGDVPNSLAPSISSTNAATALRLGLSLNATTIRSGQTVNFSVSEYNTLAVMNNVSASSSWPLKGLEVGPCGNLREPFGIAVYRGYQSRSSVSSASAVSFIEPRVFHCPLILSSISQYSFYPDGYKAQIWGSCTPEPCGSVEAISNIPLNGYWNSVFATSYHTDFPPGIYTVAAGDEWGQLVLLYFVVKA